MRTTELFEMLKSIGKTQLLEKKKSKKSEKKEEEVAPGKPDTIIINPPLKNTIDQRR